jgi:hypothetical protein
MCHPFWPVLLNDATVRDENTTHRGKIDIERWLRTTIEKYKFQFKPLNAEAAMKTKIKPTDNAYCFSINGSAGFPSFLSATTLVTKL